MTDKTIEKGPCSLTDDEISRLCAEFNMRIWGHSIPVPQSIAKEDRTLTAIHYTKQSEEPQAITSDFWCERCQKFIPPERVSPKLYHAGYVDKRGNLREVASVRRCPVCNFPLNISSIFMLPLPMTPMIPGCSVTYSWH